MKGFFRKALALGGVLAAVLGFSVPNVRASVAPVIRSATPQVSEATPLYLEHARDLEQQRGCQHYSHSSHQSHESHSSHYSSRY